jgi:PKD repeat protein
MKETTRRTLYGLAVLPIIAGLFLAAAIVLPAVADDTSTLLGVIPSVSDIGNLAFANRPAGYYYFKFNQEGGGGLNALHIASSSSDLPNYGDVSTTTSQSGTLFITDTGGRGYQDRAILLVGVKGAIPDDFEIHIRSSGYYWEPTGVQDTAPVLSQVTYVDGAIDDTFTKTDFVYGSQTWKPAGNNEPSEYPLYYGQDTSDTTNLFKLMFVDLKAGPLGPNSKWGREGEIDASTLNDYGAVKVEYSLNNLDTVAVFNVYAWNDNTTQGHGISWANRVVGTGCSGYTVLGAEYADRASEFPTAEGEVPIYHGPQTNFTAAPTSGTAPLSVQFTDMTAQSTSAHSWDFGDGETSEEENPLHVYQNPGVYTVSLTDANNQGITTTKTETDYIIVTGNVASFPDLLKVPLDPDHDGRYEDINGNSRLDFHDVVTFSRNLDWARDNTGVGSSPFDFNGNGGIDSGDVTLLYYEVLVG